MLTVLLVLMMIMPCAYAVDFSNMNDQSIENLLTVLEYFEPMTKEEIQQFTDELRAEKAKREAARGQSVKGSIIYEDDDMRLTLVNFYTQDDMIYGPLSIVKLKWLNKKNEALTISKRCPTDEWLSKRMRFGIYDISTKRINSYILPCLRHER